MVGHLLESGGFVESFKVLGCTSFSRLCSESKMAAETALDGGPK